MNHEQKPTPITIITLTEAERRNVAELLAAIEDQVRASLEMLQEAVQSGESKPDNPNIGYHERELAALGPLRQRLKGKGELALSQREAEILAGSVYDAAQNQDPEYEQEIEDAKEEWGEDFDIDVLSEEAKTVYELQELSEELRPLHRRLDKAELESPNYYAEEWKSICLMGTYRLPEAKVASQMRVSTKHVERAASVQKKSAAKAAEVQAGKKKLAQAEKELKEPAPPPLPQKKKTKPPAQAQIQEAVYARLKEVCGEAFAEKVKAQKILGLYTWEEVFNFAGCMGEGPMMPDDQMLRMQPALESGATFQLAQSYAYKIADGPLVHLDWSLRDLYLTAEQDPETGERRCKGFLETPLGIIKFSLESLPPPPTKPEPKPLKVVSPSSWTDQQSGERAL